MNLERAIEWLKSPYSIALIAILAGSAYLRFQYAFFDGMWVDEARYSRIGIEISKHLLEYSVASEWHGSITKFPPLYPYLVAFSTYVFGNTDFAARMVSPVMGTVGVALTYLFGREIESRTVGLLAAAMLAVNPIFWFLSERILVGATFAVVYTAALLAVYYGLEGEEYSRYVLWSVGPLVALNIMTKQPAYTLGLIIPLYVLYKERKGLKEFVVEGVEFKDSGLYDAVSDRNYYISAVLGFLALLPWMLRNFAVCQFPLCGLSRATKFADVSSTPAWASTAGPFYFLQSMPAIITVAGTFLVAFRVGQYLFRMSDTDADTVVKYSSLAVGLVTVSYLLTPKLVPMVLLASIALFATSDAEKLLWLAIGIGIGFMSIPQIKVPRYVVFVIPSLLLVASLALYSISDWLAYQVKSSQVTTLRVAVVLLLPVLFMSYAQGLQNVSQGGYTYLEPAGEWLDRNAPEDSSIAASSAAQMRFYTYPRMAYMPPNDKSEFRSFLVEKNVSYVEVDFYEKAQPEWMQTDIPPYRLPASLRQDIRSGKVSAQEAASRFGQAPSYLEPVKKFGQVRVPLTRSERQPMVMIYRVNLTG